MYRGKHKMKRNFKNKNENDSKNVGAGLVSAHGITLISLVIIIILLIILAGVAISLSLGENGIFRKAQFGAQSYTNAQDYEKTEIGKAINDIESNIKGSRTDISQNNMRSPINIFSAKIVGTGSNTTLNKGTYKMSTSFTKTPNNYTSKYLEVQDDGKLKIKKSGWYNISGTINFTFNGASVVNNTKIYFNDKHCINFFYVAAVNASEYDSNNYTVFLTQNDSIDIETTFDNSCNWAGVDIQIQAFFE